MVSDKQKGMDGGEVTLGKRAKLTPMRWRMPQFLQNAPIVDYKPVDSKTVSKSQERC